MYIEKAIFQRIVFVLFSIILGMSIALVCHECETPEPETKVVVQTVYILMDTEEAKELDSETVKYFDVPLTEDLQDHIFKLCEERGVDPALVMGMIRQESNFNPNSIGDNGNAYGLLQIWPRWHSHRMEQYGCTDLLDPYQNITVGVDIIADWLDQGKGVEYAIMGYNGGSGHAKKMIEAGKLSEHAKKVLNYAREYGYEG